MTSRSNHRRRGCRLASTRAAALLLVPLALCVGSGWFTHANASTDDPSSSDNDPSVHTSTQSIEEVLEYWTPERMANATPMGIPTEGYTSTAHRPVVNEPVTIVPPIRPAADIDLPSDAQLATPQSVADCSLTPLLRILLAPLLDQSGWAWSGCSHPPMRKLP